jgi:hypothetical protein
MEVFRAWSTGAQVRGDTGIPLRRRGILHNEVDVNVEHLHRMVAAHVAGIGLQEAVKFRPAIHGRLAVS